MTLSAKACDAGRLDACDDLGTAARDGLTGARDLARAATLFKKACDGSVVSACMNLAGGITGDRARASDATWQEPSSSIEQACNGGHLGACVGLGVRNMQGQGTKKDAKRANELFEQVCRRRSPMGCFYLAISHRQGQGVRDDRKAARLFKQACDVGAGPACTSLGWAFSTGTRRRCRRTKIRRSRRGSRPVKPKTRGAAMRLPSRSTFAKAP